MFLRDALHEVAPQVRTREAADGVELLDYLWGRSAERPYPDLILLDLKMPRMGGLEALDVIRRDNSLPAPPIIIVCTTADDNDSVMQAYDRGANAFVGKPAGHDDLRRTVAVLVEHWLGVACLPTHAT